MIYTLNVFQSTSARLGDTEPWYASSGNIREEYTSTKSTQVNRLITDCFVIVIPVHFGDCISCSTGMHYASDSKLDVAVFWIGCIDYFTIGMSAVKNNLVPINEIDGTSDFVRTDFLEEISPLLKCQDLRALYEYLIILPSQSQPQTRVTVKHISDQSDGLFMSLIAGSELINVTQN